MLSFFKKWMNQPPKPEELKEEIREESVLPAEEAAIQPHVPVEAGGQEQQARTAEEGIVTPLSLHESWEENLDANRKYALSFAATELPPIQPGNVSIVGTGIGPHEDGLEVLGFVRNGLPRPIRLGTMNLVILTKDNQLFARQSFDLSELGEIPPYHARPWSFVFHRDHFLLVDILLLNWKLAFELAQKQMVLPQQLELEESWIKALSEEQKQQLIQLAKKLPALRPGEVNVQSVQISRGPDGSLRALLLIRNGSEQSLNFEKLPLVLIDAAGDEVARGLFELGGLRVNAGTSKPWLFIFPAESIVKAEPDLSRWRVQIPQGQP